MVVLFDTRPDPQHNFDALRWPCLDISEALFNDLRTAPESNLTVKEFVSVQIYTRFAELKSALEQARHDRQQALEDLAATSAEAERTKAEASRAVAVAHSKYEALKLEADAGNNLIVDLRQRLSKADRELLEYMPKSRDYDKPRDHPWSVARASPRAHAHGRRRRSPGCATPRRRSRRP